MKRFLLIPFVLSMLANPAQAFDPRSLLSPHPALGPGREIIDTIIRHQRQSRCTGALPCVRAMKHRRGANACRGQKPVVSSFAAKSRPARAQARRNQAATAGFINAIFGGGGGGGGRNGTSSGGRRCIDGYEAGGNFQTRAPC
jgi:hypothetical protein